MERYKNIGDMELLALMREGDELAFKELFDRHYIDLSDQAAERLQEASGYADDIVQQVFIDFWAQRKYDIVEDNVKGYLAGMMHFKAASFLRTEIRKKQNLHKYFDGNTELSIPETPLDDENALVRQLNILVSQLPPQCREVFIAAYFEDNTYQEVADRLGISKNTVKSHMKTAMAKMKAALKGLGPTTVLFLLTTYPFYHL